MLRRKPSNASEKEQNRKPKRSSSFKHFDRSKPPSSPLAAEKEFDLNHDADLPDGMAAGADETKSGSSKLGKKWRAVISRTMNRRTGRSMAKVLAEERCESGEEEPMSPMTPDEVLHLRLGARVSQSPSESDDNLHNPISRQASSSGDPCTPDSELSSRDSMDNMRPPYLGPFCGRCRVHTDFVPSPYDVDSLKLKKGDIINIIEKTPVGTWTGLLKNKQGSFKFIYVDILPKEEEKQEPRKSRIFNKNKKPKPKNLQELLNRINLQEHISTLLLNGYQTLDDFKELKETHLKELNITDPEQRAKLLNAADLLLDYDTGSDTEDQGECSSVDSQRLSSDPMCDIPRDSGCYECCENLENVREESESNGAEEQLQDSPAENSA